MADPINPRHSGEELLEQILRDNPHLSRETVLKVAASAGFDLLELGKSTTEQPRLRAPVPEHLVRQFLRCAPTKAP